jgi:haloacetate dehalogenase
MFDGFELTTIDTGEASIHVRHAGSGPPLLLLHGYPQTHAMWHLVAPALAEDFTVVATDLRGYGESSRPPSTADHWPYTKRAMAQDQVAVMKALGFERFAVCGHDRGARVGYRMALDDPHRVSRLAMLDIVPTGETWRRADAAFGRGYWHWYFLAQPAPLPERMIAGDLDGFWIAIERMGISDEPAYRAQLDDPTVIEAMCEDYRAGATIDRALDDAETGTITCPVRVLWGADGALPRFYDDPLELWRRLAPHATGAAIAGAGHFLVEDRPGPVITDLLAFL